MPDIFQLIWPVDSRRINQRFGENPETYKPFNLPGHEGIDFFAPANGNVYAAADGEVFEVGHPPNHPYGLHVRLKHVVAGATYRTVYAHLSQTLVSLGQQVRAGQVLGLADNSGNSFGDHLHLTLKIDGAKTPGYPDGIVDPLPFLKDVLQNDPPASDLTVYSTDKLNLRSAPTTAASVVTVLPENEALTVLGDAQAAKAKLGKQGEFIQVKTLAGKAGFVAAFYARLTGQIPPVSNLTIFPTTNLNVRALPSTEANLLVTVALGEPLTVLGDAERAKTRIGQRDQWINVKATSGHAGYVAAWLVTALKPIPVPPGALIVFPTANLNVRKEANVLSPRVGGALFNKPLVCLEQDLVKARAKIGKKDVWLQIRTEAGIEGFVSCEFLTLVMA